MARILYSRAYVVGDVERFAFPPEARPRFAGRDEVCFLHEDFRLTAGASADDPVLYDGTADAWRTFCREALTFHVPEDCRS